MKSDKNYFAVQLRNIMFKKNITQTDLAKKLGVTQTMISHWISGDRNPTLNSLEKISKALNIPISYLTEDNEYNKNQKNINKEFTDSFILKFIEEKTKRYDTEINYLKDKIKTLEDKIKFLEKNSKKHY